MAGCYSATQVNTYTAGAAAPSSGVIIAGCAASGAIYDSAGSIIDQYNE